LAFITAWFAMASGLSTEFACGAQGFDAVVGEGVIAEERVLFLVVEHLLIAEVVEEAHQSPTGLAGRLEIGRRRLVGPRFLFPRIAERGDLPEIAGRKDQPGRRAGLAGERGENAQADAEEHRTHRRLGEAARSRQVAAGDVAGFVGDDPDELVGGLGL
jgi:hypothetical protein